MKNTIHKRANFNLSIDFDSIFDNGGTAQPKSVSNAKKNDNIRLATLLRRIKLRRN